MLKHVFLFAVVAISIKAVNSYSNTEVTVDQDFLLKQQKIYKLLFHIFPNVSVYDDLYLEGSKFDIEANKDSYNDQMLVKEFMTRIKSGMLKRESLFSPYDEEHKEDLRLMFRLFYSAKDFGTFYRTAAWARHFMNGNAQGLFVTALTAAVMYREDSQYIVLPPMYEVYPQLFFDNEFIAAAIEYYQKSNSSGKNEYIIDAKYSSGDTSRAFQEEMKLNYYLEDMSLNSYYFFFRMDNPFWLSSDEFDLNKRTRGEEYFHGHRQLYNRYNLERLANGLPEVEDFAWDGEIYPGYYPKMTYENGQPLPQRPQQSKIPAYKSSLVEEVSSAESRVSTALDSEIISNLKGEPVSIRTNEGLNLMGNLIEGNEDSLNRTFHGSIDTLARRILGSFNPEPKTPNQVIPSALESTFACMRDPAFYRIYKRIGNYYYRYKALSKPYPKEQVVFSDLKLNSLTTDKLFTFFENFDATISNGLSIANQKEANSPVIKARQQRLNYKPFNVNMVVNSDKPQKVAVQLFLGPKYDSQNNLVNFSDSYKYFFEMDYWIVDLTAGENKLVRNSHDFPNLMPDKEPSDIFSKRVEKALAGTEQFTYKQSVYGFPEHLVLPKGSLTGSPYRLFAYVSPVAEPLESKSRVFGNTIRDNKPMGFPLDRSIDFPNFQGPNMLLKDVKIYFESTIQLVTIV